MTPIEFLQSLLKLNRGGTILIMTGLGVLAAAAIAVSWMGGGQNVITLALYILGFGVIAAILTFVVSNPLMKTVLGWMFVVVFGVILFCAFDSVIQITGRTPSPPCWRTILEEPPRICEARFENGQQGNSFAVSSDAPDLPAQPAGNTSEISGTPITDAPVIVAGPAPAPPVIHLQFTPPITRTTSREIARDLADNGWDIAGGSQGGEEVTRGPSRTQIRYYSADYAENARWLARDLSARLDGAEILVNDFSQAGLIAQPNLLEIWLAPQTN
ncbi:hypothetical protein SAMN05444149_102157 [Pseudosulfitobacter pseudonitzschiae]|uniref:Uncharacterized protein n=1 Tax=Pseudosulfitobacter pseudonitzschiae TaxID=1402135 RepID=A0A073JCJ1_9RHOB|nr:hypothetical protein [Pseudosulfitobacter pseudonitzschiae]KEJ95452.1 hypothetical protein SUH3_20925 [Pseudosulfitobacter pseudonitzschiae]QKS10045.1 hypothetical protein HT745_16880 [Pseudosulfitobacter pseudonitzschiae]SHE87208.1 hypothetical protein SAMN05444149_102157 [Pseudosulfitobacter pseudonitzschiae]